MDVVVKYRWWEKSVIPPRCRKPRDVEREGQMVVELPEVTAERAPVAFRVPHWASWRNSPPDEYRWFYNHLYEPMTRRVANGPDQPVTPGGAAFPESQSLSVKWEVGSGLHAESEVFAAYRYGYLIVDGIVWKALFPGGEPRYEINTLGLGHNHGGTLLAYALHFNGNIHRDRYFRADRYDEAKAEAIRIALARGDTDSVSRLEETPPIEVLIPEAVRCDPRTHGEGDPFLNRLYGISEAAPDATTAGLLTLSTLAEEIGS